MWYNEQAGIHAMCAQRQPCPWKGLLHHNLFAIQLNHRWPMPFHWYPLHSCSYAGAFILEMDNRSLAKAWLRLNTQSQRAVYFGSDNKAWVQFCTGLAIRLHWLRSLLLRIWIIAWFIWMRRILEARIRSCRLKLRGH